MSGLPPKVTVLLAGLAAGLAATAAAGGVRGPRPSGEGGDCTGCHADAWPAMKVVHPPVAQGLCGACHRSTSDTLHRFELSAVDPNQLCLQCHNGRSSQPVKHPPVAQGLCLSCHDPHASDHPARLRRPVLETCSGCHLPQAKQHREAKTQHGALVTERNERSCVACHDPHQGEHPRRLVAWPAEKVCLQCHDQEVEAWEGTLANLKAVLDAAPEPAMRHGPVREGTCQQCHNPHGSDAWRLLRADFPRTLYAPYEGPETYALCFGCHDRRLLETRTLAEPAVSHQDVARDLSWRTRPEGKRLVRGGDTGFRNGDENLHFRHVNKADKGRVCRFCHDFHASPNPKHIRTTTRFGEWDFKLNYQKTTTGGSCWPGCHVERKYDRAQKQVNPR